MFRKKPKEPTSTDIPQTLGPWEMLDEAEIATQSARLRARYPDRSLTAIARRIDADALACFDKGADGTGKSVVVFEDFADADKTKERRYPGFSQWFDAALTDS